MTRLQLPNFFKDEAKNELNKLTNQVSESELTSYGVMVNSFHELEPDYSVIIEK